MADPDQAQASVEKEENEEELKERLEREHGELLEELRSLIPGAEVLFGFLLAIRFTGQFGDLGDTQRYVYYVTLLSTATALVFLLAPAAYHRIRFRAGDKESMVSKGNREAIGIRIDLRRLHGRPLPRDRPHLWHRPGDRRRGRVLRVDRVALVGDRSLSQLPGYARNAHRPE